MRHLLSIFCVLFACSSNVLAQQTTFPMVDAGVLTHSNLGKGVVMVIKPEPMPESGSSGPEITSALLSICNHYAPTVLPFVMERAELEGPEFIAVRIVSGRSVGRYLMQAYEISDSGCGNPLN